MPFVDDQLLPKTPWNYAFAADGFAVTCHEPGAVPFSQDHPPVTIKANLQQIACGRKFPYKSISRKPPKSRVPINEAQEIELCPYGCARLRMTEMPVLGKSSYVHEDMTHTAANDNGLLARVRQHRDH